MHPRECDCASCAPGRQLPDAGSVRDDEAQTDAGLAFAVIREFRKHNLAHAARRESRRKLRSA